MYMIGLERSKTHKQAEKKKNKKKKNKKGHIPNLALLQKPPKNPCLTKIFTFPTSLLELSGKACELISIVHRVDFSLALGFF